MNKYITLTGLIGLVVYQLVNKDWNGVAVTVATILGMLGLHNQNNITRKELTQFRQTHYLN
jgi:hypothetical protein